MKRTNAVQAFAMRMPLRCEVRRPAQEGSRQEDHRYGTAVGRPAGRLPLPDWCWFGPLLHSAPGCKGSKCLIRSGSCCFNARDDRCICLRTTSMMQQAHQYYSWSKSKNFLRATSNFIVQIKFVFFFPCNEQAARSLADV